MKVNVRIARAVCVLLLTFSAGRMFGQDQPFNFVGSPMLSQGNRVNSSLSHFTGRLGMSVPIYSYSSTSSSLELQVSLDYGGGNLNILQNPSAVGAGWQLSAGGTIFRSVNGLPDDRTNPSSPNTSLGYFYNPANIPDNPCCIDYQGPGKYDDPQNKIHWDGEEDDYFFEMNGRQGRLLIPRDIIQTGSMTAIKTIPQSTTQIYFSQGAVPANTTTTISEWIAVDEKGIEYHFGAPETMQRKTSTLNSDGGTNYHYSYTFQNEYFITAWHMTKMIDKNTGDEIDFNYTSYAVSYATPNYPTIYTKISDVSYSTYNDPQGTYKGTAQRLTSITFKNGDLINFVYDSRPRADFISDHALTQIQVTSAVPGHQLTFNLKQNYITEATLGAGSYKVIETPASTMNAGAADNLGAWLFLKGITQLSADGSSELPVASFGYYRNAGTESSVSVPTRFSGSNSDNWGYPSPGSQFGVMDTVFNVNGGWSFYQFEFNDYLMSDGVTTGMPGGVRIKTVTKYDGVSHANDLVTNYTYKREDGKSSGFTTVLPPNYYQNSLLNSGGGSDNYAVSLPYNFGMVATTLIHGNPTGYSRVVESTAGGGSTVYEFTTTADYAPLYTTLNYPFPSKPQLADWAYGLPKMTTVYDQYGRKVRSDENHFNVVINTLNTANYRSMKMAYKTEATSYVLGNATCAGVASTFNFTYEFYYPTTGLVQLTQNIKTDYPANGKNLVNIIDYTYDPAWYTTTKTSVTNSKGERTESYPFYLYQSTNTSSTVYGYASAYNLLTSPIGNITILTKTDGSKYIVSLGKTNYQMVNNVIRPWQTLTSKIGAPVSIDPSKTSFTPDENYGAATSALVINQTFDQYDANGALLQSTDPIHNKIVSTLWDAKAQKQVAQCNAGAGTIDYTSFENGLTGNWVAASGYSFVSGGITGSSAFSGTLNKSQALSGTFILTLWNKVGTSATANGSAGTVLLTRNNYQLRSWTLTNPSSIQIIGTNIDEVRLYPKGAQMLSCTFSPLTGITSSCDINNRITYYEYDGFNRLKDVRDQDGNIVRTFEYHYRGM